jgi:hypothetical protein
VTRVAAVPQSALLLALVFAQVALSATNKGSFQTYANAEYSYRLSFPSTWHLAAVPGGSTPTLYNYSSSFRLGQGLFPFGGAEIFFLPLAAFTDERLRNRSERDWITADVKSMAYGKATIEAISDIGNPQLTDIFRVEFDQERVPGEDLQRDVYYYFKLDARPFKVGLAYWKGDRQSVSHEQVLRSVVRSIRNTNK